MRRYVVVILICSLSFATTTYTADVLRQETGTRALGMGGAYTAIADDTSALFYNPAGLAKPGLQFSYSEEDLSGIQTHAGFEDALKIGSVGYSSKRYISLNDETTDVYALGFGVRGLTGIDYGLVYKHIVQNNPIIDGNAYAFDVGTLVHMTPELVFGLNAQNILVARTNTRPSYRLGGAYQLGPVLFSSDTEFFQKTDDPTYPQSHHGLEWEITDGFALRTGFNNSEPTYGVSVGLFGFIWEYALQTHEHEPIYRFGAKLGNEKSPKVRNYSLIKPKEYLEINLDGSLGAGQSEFSILGGQHDGADLIMHKIHQAADDKDICGIIIKLGEFSHSLGYFGIVQEMRKELERFKAKGKVIIVYLDNDVSAHAYYLASVGDTIVMPKFGAITSLGTSLTITRLKGLYEKLGLNYQVVKIGAFKDATHPANPGYTEDQRQHITGLVQDINTQIFSVISTSRNISSANIAAIRDGSIVPGTQALEYKLVDKLGYYDTAQDEMQAAAKLTYKPKIVTLADLPAYDLDMSILPDYNTVAVIDIDGAIMDGKSKTNFLFGGKIAGADTICTELKKLEEKEDIRAVIVRINSPGGSALAADRIYQQLKKLKDKGKYIVISMGNIAASGGYYIAAAGDIIIANPGTLTGSIGVIGEVLKGKKLFEYLNIKEETIKTGDYLDMETFGRDLTEVEKQMLTKYQEQIYEQFKLIVAEGRHLHVSEVEPLAQGKIYTGQQALKNKLIDRLGSFFDAVDVAKAGAKIQGTVKLVRIIPAEDDKMLFIRSRVVTMLGLDQLSLVNLKTMLGGSLIKLDSHLQ